MAYQTYLKINGVELPLPESYKLEYADVEADSGGETEAGTVQRDIVRIGRIKLDASFLFTAKWAKILSEFKEKEKLVVEYLDTRTFEMTSTEMFMSSFSSYLKKDGPRQGLWSVSITFSEL